jgi:hypothetical protein
VCGGFINEPIADGDGDEFDAFTREFVLQAAEDGRRFSQDQDS